MRHSTEYDPSTVTWHKSSYSGPVSDDCLEVATGHPSLTPVRDSKHPSGPKLVFRAVSWAAFVEDLKQV
ncbi:DUF397 domain-containing protein [Streptomyces sp. 4F14]|uniref:DUF397 domain-containing protein n=1 Tax=Streptomyces sp. 4F14 TaxID=3394380 RepID=UPI003A8B0AC6